jgi:hypothetical protein
VTRQDAGAPAARYEAIQGDAVDEIAGVVAQQVPRHLVGRVDAVRPALAAVAIGGDERCPAARDELGRRGLGPLTVHAQQA